MEISVLMIMDKNEIQDKEIGDLTQWGLNTVNELDLTYTDHSIQQQQHTCYSQVYMGHFSG